MFALVASLAVGCSSDPEPGGPGGSEECDQDEVGEDCTCDDDAEGQYECNDGDLECACEPVEGDDDDEAPVEEEPTDDDEEPMPPRRDAGRDSGGGAIDGGRIDARVTPPSNGDSSTPSSGDSGGGEIPSSGDGPMPKIPEPMGACPEFRNGTIMVAGHGGVNITAGAAGKKGPLLFYWHGTGQSASEANRFVSGAMRNEIISNGGIIASFNGRNQIAGGRDCSGTGAHNSNDFKAADQIVACAVKNHGIDPRRIYTTGCSAGGLQSGCMAGMRSSYIAAAAPNSGGIVGRVTWEEQMGKPAIFTMHGGASDVVIVTFSQTSNALDMQAKMRGSFVVNCNHGGGHCSVPGPLYQAAWQFMKDHPYGTTPDKSPWKGGVPSGTPNYCKVF